MVHQYVFEFKYKKVVFGKERELTHEVNVLDNNYQSACKKAIEHTKDHFHQWNDEGSSFKYVGEKINGVFKPFVEEVKGEENMWLGKSRKELINLNKGLMIDVDVQKNEIKTLKQRCETNHQKIESLQKRVDGLKAKANYKSGFTFIQDSRGSGKTNFETELFKKHFKDSFLESKTADVINEMIKKIENKQPHVIDVNSMYPQAVDVCKVYQIERDQALKENEAINKNRKLMRVDLENSEKMNRLLVKENEKLCENIRFMDKENWSLLNAVAGYKKELSQLNLLMDDMENRLEKQVVAREGMLKQLREYKAEKKRMNKIIDALTEDK